MAGLSRISASVDSDVLEGFDAVSAARGYPTRSKALENLMRGALAEQEWLAGSTVSGAVTLVYDHHRGSLVRILLDVQHDFGEVIVCTQHVHLDHDRCLEVIITRGPSGRMKELLARLNSIKGLQTRSLMIGSAGVDGG
jgi:CopG family transcriptional regulator, nickel-responsive regulator